MSRDRRVIWFGCVVGRSVGRASPAFPSHRLVSSCRALHTPAPAQALPFLVHSEGVPLVPNDLDETIDRYRFSDRGSFQGWLAGTRRILYLSESGGIEQAFLCERPGRVAAATDRLGPTYRLGVFAPAPRASGRYDRREGGREARVCPAQHGNRRAPALRQRALGERGPRLVPVRAPPGALKQRAERQGPGSLRDQPPINAHRAGGS